MPVLGAVTVAHFDQGPPQIVSQDQQSWLARSANFVVRVTRAKAGARIERKNNSDEYFVLVPETGARIESGVGAADAGPGSLVIVPPGLSAVIPDADALIVSVFSAEASDLMAGASNAEAYVSDVGAAPLDPWPMPLGGYRLRVYRLSDYDRDDSLMRIFRTRNLMINVFRPRATPRDVRKLSPHAHLDFEQGSLCLRGRWMHHIRYPWTPDFTTWKPDEAIEVSSPSLTVIPAQAIHTSRNLENDCSLVDVFAPPRADFSRREGLVCNGDEYPMPPAIAALPPLSSAD
jgi:hypothetical protein